jgi:hypothetical protein
MLFHLPPEAAGLFDLMSAQDWKDSSPKMPTFTKKVMEDRDSNRALGEMKTLSKRWPGRISKKGFLSFLSNGYAADNISDSPGGFRIFMFSPLGALSEPLNQQTRKAKSSKSSQVKVWERGA